jgi:hypothetical protein
MTAYTDSGRDARLTGAYVPCARCHENYTRLVVCKTCVADIRAENLARLKAQPTTRTTKT